MKFEILPSKSRWVAVHTGKSVSVTFECKDHDSAKQLLDALQKLVVTIAIGARPKPA